MNILKSYNPIMHPGVKIIQDNVYSRYNGVVLQVSDDTVSILVDFNHLIRYGNLTNISVKQNSPVSRMQFIGDCIQQKTSKGIVRYVYIEYLLSTKYTSYFPFKVSNLQFFKQDPTPLIENKIMLNDIPIHNLCSTRVSDIPYDESIKYEFDV